MTQSIKNRIFGADISPKIKQKLEYSQALAKSANPGDSLTAIDEKYGNNPLKYKSNFNNEADLSSRTPFARMWTAVSIFEDVEVQDKGGYLHQVGTHSDFAEFKKQYEENNPNEYIKSNDKGRCSVHEWVNVENTLKIYEIGNHILNTEAKGPNVQISTAKGNITKEGMREILPNEQETDGNRFFKPQAGITGLTSETEGPQGYAVRTSINFVVHNFSDFEKIYLRYFLRPGAQVFVDFGWDTAELYDIEELV